MSLEQPLQVTLRHLARTGLPVIAVDGQGRIAFWSEKAFDRDARGVLGKHLNDVQPLEDGRGHCLDLATRDLTRPFAVFTRGATGLQAFHCAPLQLPNRNSSLLTLIFFAAADSHPTHPLTPRELEVVRLLASGVGTREIASKLHISPTTVRNHVQNVLRKLDLHSRIEVVAWARQRHLLDDNGQDDENAS